MLGWTLAGGLLALILLGNWVVRRLNEPTAEERMRLASARAEATRSALQEMRRLERPSLTLVPAEQPGFSKIGGEPDLPETTSWPRVEGQPLAFLAQLDLRDVRAAGGPEWLPAEGKLWAFNDDEGYGTAEHVHVLHAPSDVATARYAAPSDLAKRRRYGERSVGFRRDVMAPSLEWLGVDIRDFDISGLSEDELAGTFRGPHLDGLQHRIGGYPAEIQDERMPITAELLARGLNHNAEITPEIEHAALEWRLLLQIDSDPELGMNFGDAGLLYVFIKEKHARTGDFSKTVANWQTY